MQCRRQIERDYSAQNTRAKISKSLNVHAKVRVFKFSWLFHGSYFCVLVVGRENRENVDLAKISCYMVVLYSGHIERRKSGVQDWTTRNQVSYSLENMPVGKNLSGFSKRGVDVFLDILFEICPPHTHLVLPYLCTHAGILQWFCSALLLCACLCNNSKWCPPSFVSPFSSVLRPK